MDRTRVYETRNESSSLSENANYVPHLRHYRSERPGWAARLGAVCFGRFDPCCSDQFHDQTIDSYDDVSTLLPMLIYRIENSYGEGPYRGKHHAHKLVFDYYSDMYGAADHPTPDEDFPGSDVYEAMENGAMCAFSSKDALWEWFLGCEYALRDAGFRVVTYQVPGVVLSSPSGQVMFFKEEATEIGTESVTKEAPAPVEDVITALEVLADSSPKSFLTAEEMEAFTEQVLRDHKLRATSYDVFRACYLFYQKDNYCVFLSDWMRGYIFCGKATFFRNVASYLETGI